MLLELEHLKKTYETFELDCSLQLEKGRVTGFIGKNGAGKSTTFKAILGLIQPQSGIVKVLGKPVQKLNKEDKEKIGVVLSDAGFSAYLNIQDIILVMSAMYQSFDKDAFVSQCQHFSLPLKKPLKEFSTGMKAKLKLLLAMSHESELLILDEPTSGLDVIAREELLDLLRVYMENEDRGILISSHISSDLEGLCDDIYLIHEGKILLHEDTDVLLSEYGVLKVTEEQYQKMEKIYLLSVKKESFGYQCLTNQKQFYMENYPELSMEKGNIDNILTLMITGNKNGLKKCKHSSHILMKLRGSEQL